MFKEFLPFFSLHFIIFTVICWFFFDAVSIFLKPRYSEKMLHIIFSLACGLIFSFSFQFIGRAIEYSVYPAILFISILLLFRGSTAKKVMSFAVCAAVSVLSIGCCFAMNSAIDLKLNNLTSSQQVGVNGTYCLIFSALVIAIRHCAHFIEYKSDRRSWLGLAATFISVICMFVIILINGYLLTGAGNDSWIRRNITFIDFGGVFLPFIIFLIFLSLLNNLNKSIEEREQAYYSERLAKEELKRSEAIIVGHNTVKELRRDMKNHLLTIDTLSMQGDIAGLRKYTSALSEALNKTKEPVYCGHPIIDSLLFQYVNRATEASIVPIIDVSPFPAELTLTDIDISMIFGNLLNNACEAATASASKYLSVSIRINSSSLVMQIENSCDNPESALSLIAHSKSSRVGEHGFGLINARRAVEKYHGALLFEASDTTIITKLYLSDTAR